MNLPDRRDRSGIVTALLIAFCFAILAYVAVSTGFQTLLAAITTITEAVDFPAVVLTFLLFGAGAAALSAQKREDFDWGNAFKGPDGKESWYKAGILVCLVLSSWLMVYIFMNGMKASYSADDTVKILDKLYIFFVTYLVVWSGAKIVDKIADVLVDKYFKSKGIIPTK